MSSSLTSDSGIQSPSLKVNNVSADASTRWLAKGIEDIKANRLPSVLYGLIFTIAGILMMWLGPSSALFTLILLSAFMLIGPLAAVGLYDMSHRIEQGKPASLLHALSVTRMHTFKLIAFAVILGAILLSWVFITHLIISTFFSGSSLVTQGWNAIAAGQDSLSIGATFLLAGLILALIATSVAIASIPMANHKRADILTAGVIIIVLLVVWARLLAFMYGILFDNAELIDAGWGSLLGSENFLPFIATFILSGFLLATLVFSISVVTVPLLFHRDTSIATAIATSIQVVKKNPIAMMRWAATIAFMVLIGMGLFFIGLAITLPIIGHASWHAYRELVSEQ